MPIIGNRRGRWRRADRCARLPHAVRAGGQQAQPGAGSRIAQDAAAPGHRTCRAERRRARRCRIVNWLTRSHRRGQQGIARYGRRAFPRPTVPSKRCNLNLRFARADRSAARLDRLGPEQSRRPQQAGLPAPLQRPGLPAELSRSLLEKVAGINEPRAWRMVLAYLAQAIKVTKNEPLEEGGVIVLVGPAGACKTTTPAGWLLATC